MGVSAHPDLTGSVGFSRGGNGVARRYRPFHLIHECGRSGLDDLGMPMVALRSADDQAVPQCDDPRGPGYGKASTRDARGVYGPVQAAYA